VADALSRKTTVGRVAAMFTTQKELLLDMDRAGSGRSAVLPRKVDLGTNFTRTD
jgi:hypothetical protein